VAGNGDDTPIICFTCKHRFGWGEGTDAHYCPNCGRSLSPAQGTKGVERRARSSGTARTIEVQIRDLVERLRKSGYAEHERCADKLEALAEKFAWWQIEPGHSDESLAAHRLAIDLVSYGESLLARHPSR
jgi:hypothetical protein